MLPPNCNELMINQLQHLHTASSAALTSSDIQHLLGINCHKP